MALTKEVKQELIGKHGRNEADTGSPEVQIAMLTQRINDLTEHLRSHAKDHARTHMKGIWAAALMPYAEDLSIDEKGFRKNLRHWVDDLGIDGVFIAGKQSEFFSMSVAERKRSMEIVVD